jgi:hypothetical protein
MEQPHIFGSAPEEPSVEAKFWEGPYPEQQTLLEDKEIQKMAEQLKDEGRQFELTEDASEYVLRVKDFEGVIHVTKVDDPRVDIKGIIYTRITQPEKE